VDIWLWATKWYGDYEHKRTKRKHWTPTHPAIRFDVSYIVN
jgi:hypothetical protein